MFSRKVVAALCAVFVMWLVPSAEAQEPEPPVVEQLQPTVGKCGHSCKERVARERCSNKTQSAIRACIDRAVLTYRLKGWQAAWMRRVPYCESPGPRIRTINPLAINSIGAGGGFQFLIGTWISTPTGRSTLGST